MGHCVIRLTVDEQPRSIDEEVGPRLREPWTLGTSHRMASDERAEAGLSRSRHDASFR
jgi:hypothetical protein